MSFIFQPKLKVHLRKMNDFDWNKLRAHQGSKRDSFEELCAQLAMREIPSEAKFVRKGTPDGGVEGFCLLPNGDEWGWQAKFFLTTLNAPQWSQIEKSVRKALQSHPNLKRYFICVPRNRSDGRILGKETELDRWNRHVEKWQKCAEVEHSMNVEFFWWGSTELISILSKSEHIGLMYFWFGQHGFDQRWFQNRWTVARASAGARYTPELHVGLPLTRKLRAFSRSECIFSEMRNLAKDITRKFRYLRPSTKASQSEFNTDLLESLSANVDGIVSALSNLEFQPSGQLPFKHIADLVQGTMREVGRIVDELHTLSFDYFSNLSNTGSGFEDRNNPFEDRLALARDCGDHLDDVRFRLLDASRFADSQILLMEGNAGTGKTHALCDFVKSLVDKNTPALLLMGHQFLSESTPWQPLFDQLDLRDINAETFIGALESAAQTSNRRALLIIDALNEGQGLEYWQQQLAAFLAPMIASPWIGVIISVRRPFPKNAIAEIIRDQAVALIHEGFAGYEYEATQGFFDHYGIVFPNTPLLQPEFRHPLFLKLLCEDLKNRRASRLPPGSSGITVLFGSYLESVNAILSESLDFDQKDNLVQSALARLTEEMVRTGQARRDFKSMERDEAKKVINAFLPGREFSKSLFVRLVNEGILMEDTVRQRGGVEENVCRISYDLLTDHLIVTHLLCNISETSELQRAFQEGGAYEFLIEEPDNFPSGLLELMCIQVPEKFNQELLTIFPALREKNVFRSAFRRSLVWRESKSLSCETVEVLDSLNSTEQDLDETLDALLTVSTINNHLLNADFLDQRLRQYCMPERDAWWSTGIHRAWERQHGGKSKGAVHRLIDWAWQTKKGTVLDPRTLELASVTLAWFLTSSNRFLRDRATKALVCLLTDRISATANLIRRMSDVDDPYVKERIYAIAYGIAMRSNDPSSMEHLAILVYESVFSTGSPPVHVLLRDYARGVIERAIWLGAELDIDVSAIRPPYNSHWPSMPNDDSMDSLQTKIFSEGTDGDYGPDFAKREIYYSVMSAGDFGKYVIGFHTDWLSKSLNEDSWRSSEARKARLEKCLNKQELMYWHKYKESETAMRLADFSLIPRITFRIATDEPPALDIHSAPDQPTAEEMAALAKAKKEFSESDATLRSMLTPDHVEEFDSILQAEETGEGRNAPQLDCGLIQRYVLWRVFDLGWTSQRFAYFDRNLRNSGREASKPERIGKKYQWIAYHEFLAYLADHYQYLDFTYPNGEGVTFVGPWDSIRDIDPSCTLISTAGRSRNRYETPVWWSPHLVQSWRAIMQRPGWEKDEADLPSLGNFVSIKRDEDGAHWVNLTGHYEVDQLCDSPLSLDDVDRQTYWIRFTGIFVSDAEYPALEEWSVVQGHKKVAFLDQSLFGLMFLGEHIWSPISLYSSNWIGELAGPESCPPTAQLAALQYYQESHSFDCSMDDSVSMRLPASSLIKSLGLHWDGNQAGFLDGNSKLVVFDPTVHDAGPSALLVRQDVLQDYLSRNGLTLCWAVAGEKMAYRSEGPWGYLKFSGIFKWCQADFTPLGSFKCEWVSEKN